MKLSDALTGYWLDKRTDFSLHTVDDYQVTFKRLVEFLRDPEFEAITTNDLRRFLAHLADEYELGHKSLSNAWIALSSLWTWAETELKTPHIIRGKLKRPKFTTPTVDPFNRNEITLLLDAAQPDRGIRRQRPTGIRDRAIILVLLDTGIRAQEFCDLEVQDYDQGRGRLHIRHGKNDKQRFVPVGQRAQKTLWRYLATRERTPPNAPLFATVTGNHLDRNNLRHLLDRIGNHAGVNNVFPHRFRHTFAIEFLRAGGDLLTLQAILGHETLEMARRYAKLADQDIDQAGKNSPADNWKL